MRGGFRICLDVLKSHKKTTNFNHYTLPMFYAKAQYQVGNSYGYPTMMNVFTLTRYSGEYTPIKFKQTGLTISSLKKYVNNDP